jgi:hypothetical protein
MMQASYQRRLAVWPGACTTPVVLNHHEVFTMTNMRNVLFSIGAAIASTKIIRAFSDLGLDDVLAPVGLSRRRSHVGTDLAMLGAGILVGGAAALIFAPASGQETRRRLSAKADELGDAAAQKLRDLRENVAPMIGNAHGTSQHHA